MHTGFKVCAPFYAPRTVHLYLLDILHLGVSTPLGPSSASVRHPGSALPSLTRFEHHLHAADESAVGALDAPQLLLGTIIERATQTDVFTRKKTTVLVAADVVARAVHHLPTPGRTEHVSACLPP